MHAAAKYLCFRLNKEFNARIPESDIQSSDDQMADKLTPDLLRVPAIILVLSESMTKSLSENFIDSYISNSGVPDDLRARWATIKGRKKEYERETNQIHRARKLLKEYQILDNPGVQPSARPQEETELNQIQVKKEKGRAFSPPGPESDTGVQSSARDTVRELLARQEDEFEKANSFDPTNQEDAHERLVAEIVRRRGQPVFRRKLLRLYEGQCAISGCEVEATLEAAHIVPYRGPDTNHPLNGLLLRADLHMLFDLGLIAVDTETMTILIAPELEGTWYAQYGGVALRLPQTSYGRRSQEALDMHKKAAGLTVRST